MRCEWVSWQTKKLEEIKNNIYIYIYGYLINCEYFNNLNANGYYGRDMYIPIPIPIPNWKSWGFPHTHSQSMRGFPVKTGTSSDNTHGSGFICHLYFTVRESVKSTSVVHNRYMARWTPPSIVFSRCCLEAILRRGAHPFKMC